MDITEVGFVQSFPDALKAGLIHVEAASHGCCYDNDNNPIRSMTKTLIRHATKTDFDFLLEIDEASFPGGVAYDAAELAYFMNREGAETIVVELDGRIVAFLIMEVHRNRRRATIVTIDVVEGYRRNGYGSQLLKHSEQMLSDYGVEVYELQVDVTNHPAIIFYKKHGFKNVRVLPKYYANGHDAYLMMKELCTT